MQRVVNTPGAITRFFELSRDRFAVLPVPPQQDQAELMTSKFGEVQQHLFQLSRKDWMNC